MGKRKNRHILNERIRMRDNEKIRLIRDDNEPQIISMSEARKKAEDEGLDLMLITNKADLPVIRICDYNKFLYKEEKRIKEQQRKQKKQELKELRVSPNISEHDLDVKKRKLKEFIEDGNKVKLDMLFKGRMITHKELGEKVLLQIAKDFNEIAKPDNLPKLEGKKMSMILSPKK